MVTLVWFVANGVTALFKYQLVVMVEGVLSTGETERLTGLVLVSVKEVVKGV